MEEEFIPTAESVLELLAKLTAHQNGAEIKEFTVSEIQNEDAVKP